MSGLVLKRNGIEMDSSGHSMPYQLVYKSMTWFLMRLTSSESVTRTAWLEIKISQQFKVIMN